MTSNRITNIIAFTLIGIMFTISALSIKDDVYTFDETAHIVSGYSYLTQKDYRLNPEHPPLIKDLAAFPLLFLNLNFPKDHPSWIQEGNPVWWLQFDIGNQFLYKSGNDPDLIMFWSKITMIFLLIFLGWFLFFWTRKKYGNNAALLALFFYSFSPTLIAHGRLTNTDIGAAFGVVLSTYFWIKFLEQPYRKNIILAGVMLGISLLFKFSLILLIPFLGIITIIYILIKKKNFLKYIVNSIIAGLIAFICVIWPVYYLHTMNYPPQQQLKDTVFHMETSSIPVPLVNATIWMSSQPSTRAIAHYFTGLLLAINRSATGHTTYFMGKISDEGQKPYFPIVYLIKEPIPFHILSLIALLLSLVYIREKTKKEFWPKLKEIIKNHFTEFSMIIFVSIYWLTSITSELNIGIRHLLPIFPFSIFLVSVIISSWLKEPKLKIKKTFLGILIIWQIFSVFSIHPHYIAYFNELIGGPEKGHLYAVDSNLDWGQDLKRLKYWMNENNVNKIYIDYFGGGDLDYYLNGKYETWYRDNTKQDLPPNSYLVISMSQLKGGQGLARKGYTGPEGYYSWLEKYEPIVVIGHSIAVFYIN